MLGRIRSGEETAISPPSPQGKCSLKTHACLKEEKKYGWEGWERGEDGKAPLVKWLYLSRVHSRWSWLCPRGSFIPGLRNFMGSFLRNPLCTCQGECLGLGLEKPRPYLPAWQNSLRKREIIFKVSFLLCSTLQEKSASAVYEPYGSFLFLVFCFDR